MTGGQAAPTTPEGAKSTTTRNGKLESPFDISALAITAGATFVARTTTFDFQENPDFISKAIAHKGFSVVEILTQCPTYNGRLNKLGSAVEMLDYEKDLTEDWGLLSREEIVGKMSIGILKNEQKPEYTEQYYQMCKSLNSYA